MPTWGRAPSGLPRADWALCNAGAAVKTVIQQRNDVPVLPKPDKLAGERGVGRYLVREFTRLLAHMSQCNWKGINSNKDTAKNKWQAWTRQMGGPGETLSCRSPVFYPVVTGGVPVPPRQHVHGVHQCEEHC